MSEVKICRDCKWRVSGVGIMEISHHYPQCMHPNAIGAADIVTGHVKGSDCRMLRATESNCGIDAKWFEARAVRPGFWATVFDR